MEFYKKNDFLKLQKMKKLPFNIVIRFSCASKVIKIVSKMNNQA